MLELNLHLSSLSSGQVTQTQLPVSDHFAFSSLSLLLVGASRIFCRHLHVKNLSSTYRTRFKTSTMPPHPHQEQADPTDTTPRNVAPHLPARFQSLIWACLDANLPKSAAFYAERYYALDNKCHDALHLYSRALLRCGQTHSALWLVSPPHQREPCGGCYVAQAECHTALSQHAYAGEALEASLRSRTDDFGENPGIQSQSNSD